MLSGRRARRKGLKGAAVTVGGAPGRRPPALQTKPEGERARVGVLIVHDTGHRVSRRRTKRSKATSGKRRTIFWPLQRPGVTSCTNHTMPGDESFISGGRAEGAARRDGARLCGARRLRGQPGAQVGRRQVDMAGSSCLPQWRFLQARRPSSAPARCRGLKCRKRHQPYSACSSAASARLRRNASPTTLDGEYTAGGM